MFLCCSTTGFVCMVC